MLVRRILSIVALGALGVTCAACGGIHVKELAGGQMLVTTADYRAIHLSLSRLNHWLPRAQAHPEVMQGTADLHHYIADALLPEADAIFHNATALHATVDMLDT